MTTLISCRFIRAIDCATNLEVMASSSLLHYSEGGRYTCLYCGAGANIRHGPMRSPHFYHLKGGRCEIGCGDTRDPTHLKLQEHVIQLLGISRDAMEVRIGANIADIVWLKEDHGLDVNNIVIEIQRGPITLEEKERREKNYQEHGYEVIWIFQEGGYFRLHDPCKNIYALSSCEETPTNTVFYVTKKEPYALFTGDFLHVPKRATLFLLLNFIEIHDKRQLLQCLAACLVKPVPLPLHLSPHTNVNRLTEEQVKAYISYIAPDVKILEQSFAKLLEEGKRGNYSIQMLVHRLEYLSRQQK